MHNHIPYPQLYQQLLAVAVGSTVRLIQPHPKGLLPYYCAHTHWEEFVIQNENENEDENAEHPDPVANVRLK